MLLYQFVVSCKVLQISRFAMDNLQKSESPPPWRADVTVESRLEVEADAERASRPEGFSIGSGGDDIIRGSKPSPGISDRRTSPTRAPVTRGAERASTLNSD